MKSNFFLLLLIYFGINSNIISQVSVAAGFRLTPHYSSLGKFMNEDHLINDGTNPIHDSRTYLRYGLGIDLKFNQAKIFYQQFQFTVGHRYIHESLEMINIDPGTNDEGGWIEELKYNQVNYALSYLIGAKVSSGRLTLSAAIGGALHRIGKGHQTWHRNSYYKPEYYEGWYEITNQKSIIGGGWGVGLVSQIELALKINDRLSIGAAFNNHLTFLMFKEKDQYKGTFDSNPNSIFPDSSWEDESNNDHYRIAASRIVPSFMLIFTFK